MFYNYTAFGTFFALYHDYSQKHQVFDDETSKYGEIQPPFLKNGGFWLYIHFTGYSEGDVPTNRLAIAH
ncbi:MAG: hypothetical protein HW390_595 [Candidatus Brocadiaceae bacterium]|nr:hypothetical protein [Candidatus Brocadiaceae bacterium]